MENFPSHPLLSYALEVEKVTTAKVKSSSILIWRRFTGFDLPVTLISNSETKSYFECWWLYCCVLRWFDASVWLFYKRRITRIYWYWCSQCCLCPWPKVKFRSSKSHAQKCTTKISTLFSMGFIGHFLDQKRLKQGLYRHPWDDISYVMPELNEHQ